MRNNSSRIPTRLFVLPLLFLAASASSAPPIPLRAGPITLVFEPDTASLRYLKAGSQEILRGITAPVRNQHWGTVLPVVSNVRLAEEGERFTLDFEVVCKEREIDFFWRGRVVGDASGEIEYTFDGTARSSFLRNRIGFCVLHGPSAAGQPWVLEDIRGGTLKGHFPEFISPHQPAKELREIAHEAAPGLWSRVRMEGDTFEMEDQRNWTDASFKTYCTPLEIPYPVAVSEGTRIQQRIRVRVEGAAGVAVDDSRNARPILSLTGATMPLPRLGLQVSSQTSELSEIELKRLKALRLDHLRVDLAVTNHHFARQLRQATVQARALGVKLHVGLRLGPEPVAALETLSSEVRSARPPVSLWIIIGADAALCRQARSSLRRMGGRALVAAAHEDINFTQLNRVRPEADMLEAVVYGVTPQIHAFDNLSIMETLPIQGETVRSARQFIGDSALVITPITLRPQAMAQAPMEFPFSVDPRQPTVFAAAWTLGSLKYLAEAGVWGCTYYETVGWKGVMETAQGSPAPTRFPSTPGGVYPVYHLLRDIGEFVGGSVERMDSTDTLAVAGLALRKRNRLRVLVANLTDRPQPAAIRGLGENLRVENLEVETLFPEETGPGAGTPLSDSAPLELPILLPPYGIVRIERNG